MDALEQIPPVEEEADQVELAQHRQNEEGVEPSADDIDTLEALGNDLADLFSTYEQDRLPVEQRWVEDTRQFNGKYDPDVLAEIVAAGGSQLFPNITRSKTNTFAARLGDMLLPTGERNFGMTHTPVPKLAEAMQDHSQAIDPKTGQPMEVEVQGQDGTPQKVKVTNAQLAAATIETAKRAAELMEEEVADQLLECNYNAIARQSIDELALLGTGAIEGPVVTDKRVKRWKVRQEGGVTVYYADEEPDPKPAVRYVSVWNLYLDMSASSPSGWTGIFEQFLCNKREVQQLAKEIGFYKAAVARVLADEHQNDTSSIWWVATLRSLNNNGNFIDSRWRVLKYHGEIKPEVIRAMGIDPESIGAKDGAYGVVWFCRSVVLKVSLSPLDSGRHTYSIAYLEKDPSSPYGLGVPRLMREEQKAAAASYRMVFDNAGLSVGPQLFIKAKKVRGVDGSNRLRPRKTWLVDDDVARVQDVFGLLEIPSHQPELMAIFDAARKLADDTTSTPLIAQGDQAPHITKTAKGMSMLFNAANVVLRRCVKSFDDYFTVPLIERFYEWNMQFNPRQEIKGDFRCIGKGSSVLLEKEQMNETYMQVIQLALANPDLKMRTNIGTLWSQALKNMRIEDAILSEDEVEAARKKEIELNQSREKAAWAEDQAAKNPLLAKKVAIEERRVQLDEKKHEDAVAALLAKIRADVDKAGLGSRTAIAVRKIIEDAANQRFNAERAIKREFGEGM